MPRCRNRSRFSRISEGTLADCPIRDVPAVRQPLRRRRGMRHQGCTTLFHLVRREQSQALGSSWVPAVAAQPSIVPNARRGPEWNREKQWREAVPGYRPDAALVSAKQARRRQVRSTGGLSTPRR